MKHNQETVEQIDAARTAYFERLPDRPSGRVRPPNRQSTELAKAKSRLRTAAWRSDLDKRKRPEGAAVAMQFLSSVVDVARITGREGLDAFKMTDAAFEHALDALEQRGFARAECKAVFRRLTRRNR